MIIWHLFLYESEMKRSENCDTLCLQCVRFETFLHTFMSAELGGLRHGPHAFGVACLDFEVVRCVEGQLLDLMGESVPHHRLDHPVVYLSIDISAVVDNVPCNMKQRRVFTSYGNESLACRERFVTVAPRHL